MCCRENILKTAKALVEDTKTLVAGAASNQEQLAAAAQAAVKTITRLADVVKLGAGALGSDQPDAQVCVCAKCCFLRHDVQVCEGYSSKPAIWMHLTV